MQHAKASLSPTGADQLPQAFVDWLYQNQAMPNWYRLPKLERPRLYSTREQNDPLWYPSCP